MSDKVVVLNSTVMTLLSLLEDSADRWQLIEALDAYAKGHEFDKDAMYVKTCLAYDYLIKAHKDIFIDDLTEREG